MQLPNDLKEDAKRREAPPELKYISLCSIMAGAIHGFMTARDQPVPLEHRIALTTGPIILEGIASACGHGFGGMLVEAVNEKFEREGRSMTRSTKMTAGGTFGGFCGGITMCIGFISGYSLGKFYNLL